MEECVYVTDKLHVPKDLAKRPVVLLGCGSFNPVSIMHLRLFNMARDTLQIEHNCEVLGGYLSPVSDGYKKAGLVDGKYRKAMCELAAQTNQILMVSDYEVKSPNWLETIKVIRHLKDGLKRHLKCDNLEVWLVCGADLLESFAKPGVWADEDVEAICGEGVICVQREGVDLSKFVESHAVLKKHYEMSPQRLILVAQNIRNEISSTAIRQSIKDGRDIQYLVPDLVQNYILENNLYK